jgi:hypothetical protein
MARVIVQDTGQFIGTLVDLHGPAQSWVTDWPFLAWRHPNGTLRNYPSVLAPAQRMWVPTPLELRIPVRNSSDDEMELLIPSHLLDFIQHHTGFRESPKR